MAFGKAQRVEITRPNLVVAEFMIVGNAPFVQNKFSSRTEGLIRGAQEAGSTAKKGKKREGKDFDARYREAQHIATEGWHGMPASGFRAALISACRTVGFAMTRAKLSLFVLADGVDAGDGTALVRITKGEPRRIDSLVRNKDGSADIRPRPMWAAGWEATLRIQFDADQFTLDDVTNLLLRVGYLVGIGEGRPDSKSSGGCGWGTFQVVLAEVEQ